MGIGCGAYMAKCLLFIFNTAFFLAGGALMGIGIWIRVDPRTADFTRIISVNANDPLLQTAAIALAVVGALVFLTGFLGCCGALCSNTCMLMMWQAVYPPSCCTLKDADPSKLIEGNMVDPSSCRAGVAGYNTQGCYNGLVDWIRRNAHIIIGVAFGVIAIQILVACMACCLRTALKRDLGKVV